MRAMIVTFVRAYNYGAVLQCYALSQKLKQMGVDIEVLDYYPQYFKDLYNVSSLKDARYFPPYRPLKNWLKFIPFLRVRDKRNLGFSSFLRNYIPLTKEQYATYNQIATKIFDHDLFISGSDQVWSNRCAPFDPVYFLSFPLARQAQRYSYAASFGFASVPEDLEEEYRQRLTGWNGYSVREKSGKKILQDLVGVDAAVCCDPTLLLNKQQWDAIAQFPRKKKYILVYTVNSCEEILTCAQELSIKKKMPVIVLPCVLEAEKLTGEYYKKYGFQTEGCASPQEWLGWFSNASYVLTDSFHGTVFSLINHKPFMSITRWGNYTSFRVVELLEKVGLSSQELPGSLSNMDSNIDWDFVDEKFCDFRITAEQYLQNMINNVEKNTNEYAPN